MVLRIINAYKEAFSGLSRENWLLSLVMLINRSGTMAVVFMSIYVTHILHRSIADAGLIITLFGVGAVAGSASGGYFTDKIGFRPVQIITSLISGILFILFGLVSSFYLLCVIAVFAGCVTDAFRPANFTAIASYSKPENLTKSYSLNRLAVNIGFGLGSTIGGILAAIDYHLLFWVEGIVYITVGILIFLLLPQQKKSPLEFKPDKNELRRMSPWKDIFFLKFLFMVTVYITCFFLVFRLLPLFWKEVQHIGEARIGFILGLNGIIIAVFEMVMVQHLQSRKTLSFYIVAGMLLSAGGFVLLLVPGFTPMVIAFLIIILLTVGEMLTLPFINTIVVQRANEHNRGRYAAAYALTWAVAQIIGPAGGAFIAEKSSYNVLWVVLIVVCIGAALGVRTLFKGVG
ncbi:MFS transporter [Pollutibacter soli]|uniref:MDR family MFS transporter n=1 Tax=Pollutibacter soli TaxID=3034157 RepID=UPI003013F672